jgi:hypothetical protein
MVIFTGGEQGLGLWLVGLKREHIADMHRISSLAQQTVCAQEPAHTADAAPLQMAACRLTIFLFALVGFCSCLTGVFVWTELQPPLLLLCFVAWGCRPLMLCVGTLPDYVLLTVGAYGASTLSEWCVPLTMLSMCGVVCHLEHRLLCEAAQLGMCSGVLLRKCWISRGIGMVSGASTGFLFVRHMHIMFVGCAAAWMCTVFLMPCRNDAALTKLVWSWRWLEWVHQPQTQQNILALVMWSALPSSDWSVLRLLSPVWVWVLLSGSAMAWFVGSSSRCSSVRCALLAHALLSMAPKLLLVSVPYAQTYAQAAVVTMSVLRVVAWCTAVRAMSLACMRNAPLGFEHECVAMLSAFLCFSALVSALTGAYVWQQQNALLGLVCGIMQLILMPHVLEAYSSTDLADASTSETTAQLDELDELDELDSDVTV